METTESWSGGTLTLLLIGAFFFPIVGIIGGCVGLSKPATRSQGTALLLFALVMGCVWLGLASQA